MNIWYNLLFFFCGILEFSTIWRLLLFRFKCGTQVAASPKYTDLSLFILDLCANQLPNVWSSLYWTFQLCWFIRESLPACLGWQGLSNVLELFVSRTTWPLISICFLFLNIWSCTLHSVSHPFFIPAKFVSSTDLMGMCLFPSLVVSYRGPNTNSWTQSL